ncbi:MAG: hypothetical protein KDA86_23355 [Planctomycetaceae bacterium]|nr:hypothetical protein [Planctomycetaceae bacterium]
MLQSLFFVFTILAGVVGCGLSWGELSLSAALIILASWMLLLGITIAMGWPVAVVIVGTVILSVGCILAVFGGDLRIR